MARKTYVFDTNPDGTYKQPLQMVEKSSRVHPYKYGRTDKYAHNIIEDIEPYKSTIDGSVISSRSKHRQHLRENGCVEIGTESLDKAKSYFKQPERSSEREVKADVIRAFDKAG